MLDSLNRTIDYIRISITDRCNLRCGYCMPYGIKPVSHDDILRYEEILRLCGIFADIGIKKYKVTGGEPLTRKGCVDFIGRLKDIPGIEYVTMTTNAILLEPYIDELVSNGLDGINISLDSIIPQVYIRITGKDELNNVLRSMQKALDAGLRTKINCVLMKGLNEYEILSIARMAEFMEIDVRFIELMPTVSGGGFIGVRGEEVLEVLLSRYPDISPDFSKLGFGPAKYYKSNDLISSIGLINAVSDHICVRCNRLRLTGEGFLKLCLNSNEGTDLRELLRSGASNSEIKDIIVDAIYKKPEQWSSNPDKIGIESMSNIGG